MTLSDIFTHLWKPVETTDIIPFAVEYAPEINDIVICIARDSMGKVTAIGTPYCDGVERYYVEGSGWADWLTLAEIF
jgi:hypothetical protein